MLDALKNKNINCIQDIDEKWNVLSNAIVETGKNTVGNTKRSEKLDWFDAECRAITQKKIYLYQKMLSRKFSRTSVEGYRAARKEEKRVHRIKKRRFHKNLLLDVEYFKD